MPAEDVYACVFCYIVYESREESEVPGATCEERLTRVLLDPNVRMFIGSGWTVMQAEPEAALFKNTHGQAYLAICGQSSWSVLTNPATRNRYNILKRYATSLSTTFAASLKTLANDGYVTILTGHGVGGTVARELTCGIYHVRTFGSIDIELDTNPEQHMVCHYRLQGDKFSQQSISRFNVRTMCYDGSPEEAHKVGYILQAMTGLVLEYSPRTLDHELKIETLQRLNEAYPLDTIPHHEADDDEDCCENDDDDDFEDSRDELARQFLRNKRPTPKNIMFVRRFWRHRRISITTVTKPREGWAGFFVDETTTTTRRRHGTEVAQSNALNAATERALGIAIYETLQLITDWYSQKPNKKSNAFLGKRIVGLLADIGESYMSTQAEEIIASGGTIHKALPQATWAMAISFLLRNGYNIFKMSPEKWKQKWENTSVSDSVLASIEVTASLARTGLQFYLVGSKNGYTGPVMFGADLVANSVIQMASTIRQHGLDLKEIFACGKVILKTTITAGVGLLARSGATKLLANLLGKATANRGMGALSVGVGVLAFFAAKMLCETLWAYKKVTKEEQDYQQLLKKYKLKENATITDIQKMYRKKAIKAHPDKPGGSVEAFKQLSKDIEVLSSLFLILQSRKHPSLFSVLQQAVSSLQAIIRRILNPQSTVSEQEMVHLFDTLEYNPPVMNIQPRAQEYIDNGMDDIENEFAHLHPEDLQQYAAEQGYLNESDHELDEQAFHTAMVQDSSSKSPDTNSIDSQNPIEQELNQLLQCEKLAQQIQLALPYYSLELCMQALKMHNNNIDMALNWLLNQQGDEDFFI